MNAHTRELAMKKAVEKRPTTALSALWKPALLQAFIKLDPRQLQRSPVMLVVALTAVLTTVLCVVGGEAVPTFVAVQIAVWLWFTVLFANFAEALAEGAARPAPTASRPVPRACRPCAWR